MHLVLILELSSFLSVAFALSTKRSLPAVDVISQSEPGSQLGQGKEMFRQGRDLVRARRASMCAAPA